jgi:hypothetical protein
MSKRNRLSAQECANADDPGTASDYICHFASLLRRRPVTGVVLYCRVSGRNQKHTGNLVDQEAHLRRWCQRYGVRVIAVYREVGSGWKSDRDGLAAAISEARECGVPVLAESTDRYVRNVNFTTDTNPNAWPTEAEFDELARMARGVLLTTLLVPDADPSVVRYMQQNRGQVEKDNPGGRKKKKRPGDKKRRHEKLLPEALSLHARGWTLGKISAETCVPRSTIQNWISRYS